MNRSLAEMLRYNRWANEMLLDACESLTEDQLESSPHGRASVRELLVHLVGGQQTQILRTKGRQHEGELNRQSAWPGFKALRDVERESSDELVRIAESLDPESEVTLAYRGKRYRYPVRFFLVHAMEHGVEHRTEIKIALESAGIATPDLDGWGFAAASGYGQEV